MDNIIIVVLALIIGYIGRMIYEKWRDGKDA
jgi:hypothetical protein